MSEPIIAAGIVSNDLLRGHLAQGALDPIGIDDDRVPLSGPHVLAIEMIASYGMAVGADVFCTCVWIGRFIEAWGRDYSLVFRKDVKLALCGSPRAKDANIRAALMDRFGGSKEKAVGRKASPGPLYGVRSHCWSALAVAVTYCDRRRA